MATTKNGSWVTNVNSAGRSCKLRSSVTYTVNTSSPTSYELETELYGEVDSTSYTPNVRGSLYITGVGTTSSEETVQIINTTRKYLECGWQLSGWSKTHSAQTLTVTAKAWSTKATDNISTCTFTITIPAKTHYTVSYNANGGSGAPSSQTKWHGESLTLSSTKPTKSGYTFVGWNTSSTATTSNHNPGSSYTSNAALTLYAIWKKDIKLTFNANGGSNAPAAQTKTVYNSTTSTSFSWTNSATRTGYNLLGWSTSSSASLSSYSTSGTFSSSTTLYAVWQLKTYAISYANGGHGTAPSGQTKTHGTAITLSSAIATTDYYKFKSWKSSANNTEYAAGASYNIDAAATLTAQWYPRYAIYYNGNATGAANLPSTTYKVYGESCTVSSTVPTLTDFVFDGWAESQNGAGTISGGDTYSTDADKTLYATWQRVYAAPAVTVTGADRCDSSGVLSDEGTYAKVTASFTLFDTGSNAVSSCTCSVTDGTATATSSTPASIDSGLSGTVVFVVDASLAENKGYTASVTLTDTAGGASRATTATRKMPIPYYPIDILGDAYYYNLTADTAAVSGKTYYTRSGSGTDSDPYVYEEVEDTSQVDITTCYEANGPRPAHGVGFGMPVSQEGLHIGLLPIQAHNSTANTNTYFEASREDTGTAVGFGIGTGGVNHGVYSTPMNKWMIYNSGDGYVHLNGNAFDVDANGKTRHYSSAGNAATVPSSNYAITGRYDYDNQNSRVGYSEIARSTTSVYRSFAVTNPKSGSGGTAAIYVHSGDDGTTGLTTTTGTVWPIASGGTNATTAAAARTNLDVVQKNHLTTGTFSETTISVGGSEIAAWGFAELTGSQTKSGWYPICISGWSANTRYCCPYRIYISSRASGSVNITAGIYNAHSSAHSPTLVVRVLWVQL